jgi:Mg2+ and Co2+ transporter CorA
MGPAVPHKLDAQQFRRIEDHLDRIVRELRAHNAIAERLTDAIEKLVIALPEEEDHGSAGQDLIT